LDTYAFITTLWSIRVHICARFQQSCILCRLS